MTPETLASFLFHGDAHFQAVMATQRHERVVLLAAWREGRL